MSRPNYFTRLKEKWGISSNVQLTLIFIVFALTGSAASRLAGPVMDLFSLSTESLHPIIYWPLRIGLIFPLYQLLLVFFGALFGQFRFFWNFEKKMLRRLGVKL
jgi:manganese efflux pump family protein